MKRRKKLQKRRKLRRSDLSILMNNGGMNIMKKEKCGVCLTLAAVLLGMTTCALAVPVSIGAIPDAGSVTANIDQNRA